MKALYVTHYGILEPLGQTQILPYLTGLSRRGIHIEILSFEKPAQLLDEARVDEQAKFLESSGMRWHPRPYRRGNSLGQLLVDVIATSREICRRCEGGAFDLIHCRGHVPAWMAWPASVFRRIPMLFDFRGFLAEEYVDAGLWKPLGLRYQAAKRLESALLRRCAALIVLTTPIGKYFTLRKGITGDKIFRIPCCVDVAKYSRVAELRKPVAGSPVRVIYAGSTAGRYCLGSMIGFFKLLQMARPGSELTILSSGDLAEVRTVLESSGLAPGSVQCRFAPPWQVPEILSEHDLGLVFLRGNLALQAASPTKIGEYLASGLGVVAERKVGGLDEILVNEGVGWLVESENPGSWAHVMNPILDSIHQPGFREKARLTATQHFALNDGIEVYAKAYAYCLRRNP